MCVCMYIYIYTYIYRARHLDGAPADYPIRKRTQCVWVVRVLSLTNIEASNFEQTNTLALVVKQLSRYRTLKRCSHQ